MKNSILSLMMLTGIAFFGFATSAQAQSGTTSKNRIEVIDFHSTHRCMTCNAIEKQTRDVLKEHFANEMKAGTIVFRTVNVDDEENYKLAEEFEASGTALFIRIWKDGRAEKVNLTEFAFDECPCSRRF
ncbi:MAG: nitrophenyl compound nitroreductase subunit ArsF family protein [Owenweeksia sp.]|nr:nitrophenyl compound nitroreductase subunit ArsF family protein [Owenweeksia sp.]